MSNRELITVPVPTGEDGKTKNIKIFIKNPSNEVLSVSERHRAKVFNQCLMDGILTKPELAKMMNERGLWDKNKDAEHKKLTDKIVEMEKTLYLDDASQEQLDDGKNIALEIRELRLQLRDLISQKIALEENTAEAIADNAKFDYLVALCTYHETGEKVYKNIDDYTSKAADTVSFMAAAKLAEMMYSLDENYEKKLPENVWLSEKGMTNDDGYLVNKDGQLVDRDGRRVNEKGEFIDDDGNRVDRDGNLLREDGIYVSKVTYKDEVTDDKPAKKTTRSRKRTVKKPESVE